MGDGPPPDVPVGRTTGGLGVPLNASKEGASYPPVTFVVAPEHVRAFAAAIGERATAVPPTFVTAAELRAGLAQVVGDAELGLDLSRVVHAEQEYEWIRSVRVGETLHVRSTIESIRGKGGHELLVLRTEMRDDADEIVVLSRSTLLVRSAA